MTKNIKNPLVKPFVKWVGGKKQLIEVINLYRPKTFGRYYEPFVGGGSVFMNLQYSKTTINDYNTELINVYEVVRDSVDELLSVLKIHAENNSQE